MKNSENTWETIIIGGSFAGLSAALALGRSRRKVLIIDHEKPCNRFTPHSHNLLTHDGKPPFEIKRIAKEELAHYPNLHFLNSAAIKVSSSESYFGIKTEDGEFHLGRKLLFATGVIDVLPNLPGFAESWGVSIFHCPYCHGYEVKEQNLGIMANGDIGFEAVRLLSQWSKQLTLFTNGPSLLKEEQTAKLKAKGIPVIETEIREFVQNNGYVKKVVFLDGTFVTPQAVMARVPFVQHSHLPAELGVVLNEMGHIQVDGFQRTNLKGVYAAGDNTTMFRSLSTAIAQGGLAGAMINKELLEEDF
ncbi:NAD(P)/FAD-dependent oxidoreductase [Leptospira idonii]|uniref:NAD(P)/FAD-dependent oxidoreductase n=1 Tax=Leptospira idonii TaxID=1193500 RepID=A0A4R9LY94_9LEPT|nr:NAD(P)/FAD-dependent oxidoreductase [Leptospira idonii]TGN19270.1 NAD(P)/FAD-dependent oxidoreductase [Leptospira idonii]